MRGLEYLEHVGYLHRDLKPDNIMLKDANNTDDPDNFKICDFGLATRHDVDRFLFKRCGTPGFVAPEIVRSDPKNPNFKPTFKCDSFSAGVILYLLLSTLPSGSRRKPFQGRKLQAGDEEDSGVSGGLRPQNAEQVESKE